MLSGLYLNEHGWLGWDIYYPQVGKNVTVFTNTEQIKEKEYFSRYRDGDYPNDVLLIGINYNPKTKDHQCLIEKLDN